MYIHEIIIFLLKGLGYIVVISFLSVLAITVASFFIGSIWVALGMIKEFYAPRIKICRNKKKL